MKRQISLAAAVLAVILGSAPAGGQPARPAPVTGYLAADALPNSLTLLPPPPAEGSAALARDEEAGKAAVALHGGPRWDLATLDADLSFPNAAGAFSCALGTELSEAATPATLRLLRKTLSDFGRSPYPTKNKYKRARPFTQNNRPQCTPVLDAALRNDGSYPSGHAAIGWGWGLVLTEAAPDRTDAVMARARAFTDSRRICNVHWLSDVEEGRTIGAAVYARLHDNAEFRADLAAARAEIAAARARGLAPNRDCAKEAAQMAAG